MVKNQIFSPVTTNTIVADIQRVEVVDDANHPLSFKQWLKRSRGIKRGFEYEEYNNYLTRWNKIQSVKTLTVEKIKNDYVGFIRSLSLFFSEEEKKWFNDDFRLDNYLNLEEIIPHCASKLRDIMIYYQYKRDSIKRTKLKYNLVGTSTAVERMFHDYLLRAFTKHGKYVKINDPELYDLLPELKPLNTSLEIKLEEFYDDTEYMDKSPDKSATEYFGVPSEEAQKFYEENGYSAEEMDWLFGNGFSGIVADNPFSSVADDSADTIEKVLLKIQNSILEESETPDLPVSAYIDYDKTNTIEYFQKELTKKYLGENQYVLSGGYYVNDYIDLSFDIKAGNNWIYFPSGEAEYDKLDRKITPIALSATSILENEDAIGSEKYYDADKIFIKYGNAIEGAWLRDTTSAFTKDTMVCNIYANSPFSFRFPYCDYGVSGEGIDWTGPGMDNSDQTLYTLSDDEKKSILNAYWSSYGEHACNPIPLSRTSLIDCGAKADQYYKYADKITVNDSIDVHDDTPDGVFTGTKKEAFLYKVASSDIPIRPIKNYIYWPYQNTTTDGVIDVPMGGCKDTCLTADEWRQIYGSRAGYDIFDSDIIYKLDAPSGNPIECAFLKGVPFTDLSAARAYGSTGAFSDWESTSWTDSATGCFQVGTYGKCMPNAYFTFIWLDEDTPLDDVVFHIDHSPDCEYFKHKKFSLYENQPDSNDPDKTGITFKEWQDCTCGAIRYSPFGHPGKRFDDYHGYADCVFVDNTYPLPFDKNIWFGNDIDGDGTSKTYLTSEDFAWYQLSGNDQVEPDIGWGKGRWRCGGNGENENQFILHRGIQYKYFRTGIGHSDTNIIDGTMAPLIFTHKKTGRVLRMCRPTWMQAVMDSEGNWVATDTPSQMVIESDDAIVYDHIDTEWWCITGNREVEEWDEEQDIDPYRDEKWLPFVEYNVIPASAYVLSAIWPVVVPDNRPDLPLRGELDMVKWVIDYSGIDMGDVVEKVMPVDEPIYFTSLNPGVVHVEAYGYTNRALKDGSYVFDEEYKQVSGASAAFDITFKPAETVHMTSASYQVFTVSADTIGFPLNIPLYGWDYDRNGPQTSGTEASAHGARPIWGDASNVNDVTTRSKAIDKWGGGVRMVDDYIPIMQPKMSDIVLSAYSPITYETSNPICWRQDVELDYPTRDRRWCKLEIDMGRAPLAESELADMDFSTLVAKPTDETSDMVIASVIDGDDVVINYWANNGFVWNERVQDVTNGKVPTGGTYVDKKVELLVDASRDWANLSNRHFPTIAVAPVVDNFYRKEESGGYVIPQYLGASVALSRNLKTTIDERNRTSADDGDIVTDTSTYAKEYGLSNTKQNKSVLVEQTDPGWMKSSMMNGVNSGFIKNSSRNQQFVSYQTTSEARQFDDLGVMRAGDLTDPWEGDADIQWRTNMYHRHFTKQEPIAAVRRTYVRTDKIKDWVSDIYGYSYGLLKDKNFRPGYDSAINRYRYLTGTPYIRKSDGTLSKMSEYLTCLNIRDDEFYSIDIISDVLVLAGFDRVVFYKLTYDESVDKLFSVVDNIGNARIVHLGGNFLGLFTDIIETYSIDPADIKAKFVGTWSFPADSRMTCIYLVYWNRDNRVYYSYVLEDFGVDRFKFSAKRYETFTAEDLNPEQDKGTATFPVTEGPIVVQQSVPTRRRGRRPTRRSAKKEAIEPSPPSYFIVGPFVDYYDKTYTIVFQLKPRLETMEPVGRFVVTKINSSSGAVENKMVKKVEFGAARQ